MPKSDEKLRNSSQNRPSESRSPVNEQFYRSRVNDRQHTSVSLRGLQTEIAKYVRVTGKFQSGCI